MFENLFLSTSSYLSASSTASQNYTFSLLAINYLNPNDDAFIENLYTSVLARPGDIAGKAFWVSALKAGLNRGDLLNSFFKAATSTASIDSINATNAISSLIDSIYLSQLGRLSDPFSKAFYMNAVQNGFGVNQIFDNVVNTARANGIVPSIDTINTSTSNYSSYSPSPSPQPTPPQPTPPSPSPTPTETKKLLTYSIDTLDLGTKTYDGEAFRENDKLAVNGVDGSINISNGNNNVDTFITNPSGKVIKANTATGNVKAYLGGSENESGKITASSDPLDFSAVANGSIASGANALVANTTEIITLKDASSFGGSLKLDLSLVNAKVKFAAANQANIDLTTLVTGENASDEIEITAGDTTTNITGSKAQDTLVIDGDKTALTSVSGVENMIFKNGAKVLSSILSGKNYDLNGTSNFSVDATGASSVDLSKLKNIGSAAVSVENVGDGAKIFLPTTEGAQNLHTTANAANIKISGIKESDTIDFSANTLAKTVANREALEAATGITDKKLHVVSAVADDAAAATTYLSGFVTAKNATFATAGATAIVAFSDNAKEQTNIYLVSDKDQNKVINDGEVVLLATVDYAMTSNAIISPNNGSVLIA